MKQTQITEELLQEVLRSIDEGIHVVDVRGITIFYNHVAASLDGMAVEEVLGTHVLEAFPSLTSKTSTLMQVIRTGKPLYNQRQTYTNRYGKRIVTVNSTVPLRVGGRLVGALEVSKDVTRIQELAEQVIDLRKRIRKPVRKPPATEPRLFRFEQILTRNPEMMKAIERAKRAAATRSPVLVVGETGTGKELIVQSIHSASPRRDQPFIAQNCAAIPSSLLEGILFGTVKGAFTGAEDRPGLFELADGGTLFLDEIQAMPSDLQAKLLRVLEEGAVRRVGDANARWVDVRILCATNQDPVRNVKEGRLRKDLFYRIQVVRIDLPPLRERREDIPLLTSHFIREYNGKLGKRVSGLRPEVEEMFLRYDWPGNVRELKHAIEGAMNMVEGEMIAPEDLPPHLIPGETAARPEREGRPLREVLAEVEERMIREALAACGGNVRQAARRLGIPRQTLQYKLQKWGLGRRVK